MAITNFGVGDRVIRVMDGTVGEVVKIGKTDVSVRWEPSGVVQMVMPHLLKKA